MKAAAVVVLLFFLGQFLPSGSPTASAISSWKSPGKVTEDPELVRHSGRPAKPIANIVHFVRLVSDPNDPNLGLELHQFIAIYSASHFLNPDKIYIHTDLKEELFEKAFHKTSNVYMKAVNKIPNLEYRYHPAPNQTTSGKKIDRLANRSDFVRTDVLKMYGGIFLDDDAYVLRDLAPFRHAGFDMVTAYQLGGMICPAVMISTPHNPMITAYHELQDKVFDGSWDKHATHLLTALIRDFTTPEYQSLVLARDYFFLGSWETKDLQWMYEYHDSDGESVAQNTSPTTNLTEYMENFKLEPPKTWQTDMRPSYVLHGWTTGIKNAFSTHEDRVKLFGNAEGYITLQYILSRRSNFARAIYPAVQSAIDCGILDVNSELKVLEEQEPPKKEEHEQDKGKEGGKDKAT